MVRVTAAQAAGGNGNLKVALEDIHEQISQLRSATGLGNAANGSSAPILPAAPVFTVSGQDGKFKVVITAPAAQSGLTSAQTAAKGNRNPNNNVIYFQLRSAIDTNFDANSGVTTYGIGPELTREYTDPNVTKFWQCRASYDQTNWTDWATLTSAAACGAVTVYSGILASSSLSSVNTAFTPQGGNPLSQSGTTLNILIANSTANAGNQVLNFIGTTLPVGSYTTYYVYADDPKKQAAQPGGFAPTYVATTVQSDVTAADGRVYFGKITLSNSTPATGSGGGNGGCVVAEVLLTKLDGSTVAASDARVGDLLLGVDGHEECIEQINLLMGVHTFKITLDNGAILQGCSMEHSLLVADTGIYMLLNTLTVGATLHHKTLGVGKISAIEYIGRRVIYKFHLASNHTFWCDGFGSHNVLKQ